MKKVVGNRCPKPELNLWDLGNLCNVEWTAIAKLSVCRSLSKSYQRGLNPDVEWKWMCTLRQPGCCYLFCKFFFFYYLYFFFIQQKRDHLMGCKSTISIIRIIKKWDVSLTETEPEGSIFMVIMDCSLFLLFVGFNEQSFACNIRIWD